MKKHILVFCLVLALLLSSVSAATIYLVPSEEMRDAMADGASLLLAQYDSAGRMLGTNAISDLQWDLVAAPWRDGAQTAKLFALKDGMPQAGPQSISTQQWPEVREAGDLGLIPPGWEADLTEAADFVGFHQLLTSLLSLWEDAVPSLWQAHVDTTAFPNRVMHRDDGLVLLLLAAEALGFTAYNARDYSFCTENQVDFDLLFSQLSWDYPYCDANRAITLYHDSQHNHPENAGSVPGAALFWMQRRMDLSHQVHFLDCTEELNFYLQAPLTRGDAIAAAVRLHRSETRYDPGSALQQPLSPEQKAILAEAEAKKAAILDNGDQMPCTKTAYYVSNNGNDENDGLTPETAWASLEKVNAAGLDPGDGVYFQRGGLWRGQLRAQAGVIYSAYGQGEKPKLYASPENGADPAMWTLLEGTDNIWVYGRDMLDCGVLVFNNGEQNATKVAPYYVNGYLSTVNEGQPFDVRTELAQDLMFFSEADSILYEGIPFHPSVYDWCDLWNEYGDVVGPLYLRCDAGNPGEVFDSIEFAIRENLVIPAGDSVFHNLCLKYTGFHCIFGGEIGYDVSFCEIGWIGGSPQYYEADGRPNCGGNGVECDGSYDHFSVTNCYLYQIFDSGVSNQNGEDFAGRDVIERNITYARNVFEKNDAPIETFFLVEDDVGYGRQYMENVLVEDNYFLYSGFGWYHGWQGKALESSAYVGDGYNASKNFQIRNNVFFISTGPLLQTKAPKKWLPLVDGNTYVQSTGGGLIKWTTDANYPVLYGYYETTAEQILRDILGDQNARVIS